MSEPHKFYHDTYMNRWMCETEDVDANECSDETRCENQCYCNKDRYFVTLVLDINPTQHGHPQTWDWETVLDMDNDDIQRVEVFRG